MGLILASGSPRRRELLSLAGLEFTVEIPQNEECLPQNLSPKEAAEHLAVKKAEELMAKFPTEDIVAADTIVALDGKILGKPKDREDALGILTALSGRVHSVFTGVAIVKKGALQSFCSETTVEFYPLTEGEIRDYIATGEPMDKAGAYGIQGKGSLFVKSICGDYFTVVGLPLAQTVRRLKA